MTLRIALLSLALTTGAHAQIVWGADSSEGDIAVSAGSTNDLNIGVQYWIEDGVSFSAWWSESAFEDVEDGNDFLRLTDLEADARTIAASLETDWLVLGDRFTYSSGIQAFNQRQVNDVVVGLNSGAGVPVVERDIQVWGAGLTNRLDFRLFGPVHIGHQGGLLSLRVVRTQQGPNSVGADDLGFEDRSSTRLKLGGPGRFYVGVRF
ncbi:hypothetical protein [Rubrivirga sp.]|uniref:hypothetical protein n=1 Tax=Rubrivirga sp. TaxID=1885344 RepID=UPI003C711205